MISQQYNIVRWINQECDQQFNSILTLCIYMYIITSQKWTLGISAYQRSITEIKIVKPQQVSILSQVLGLKSFQTWHLNALLTQETFLFVAQFDKIWKWLIKLFHSKNNTRLCVCVFFVWQNFMFVEHDIHKPDQMVNRISQNVYSAVFEYFV